MSSDSAAVKYAEALFGIGKDAGKLDIFQQNAADFLRVLESSKDLMASLSHPNILRAQRKEIITAILQTSGYDRQFSNFVKLIVERGRIRHYPKIVEAFVGLRDEAAGRVRGIVYVASALTADQHERLRAKAQAQLGREVILEERIDASVIGGLRLEIDGRVFDSSIKRHLERMRDAIKVR